MARDVAIGKILEAVQTKTRIRTRYNSSAARETLALVINKRSSNLGQTSR
jgi:hypothetical protein